MTTKNNRPIPKEFFAQPPSLSPPVEEKKTVYTAEKNMKKRVVKKPKNRVGIPPAMAAIFLMDVLKEK